MIQYKSLYLALILLSQIGFAEEPVVQTPKNIQSLQSLLEQVKKDGLKEKALNKSREAEFRKNSDQQKRLLSQAVKELKQTKATTKKLKSAFDLNEDELSKQEEELRKRSGNLGEMFGVVRQVSQDMASIRENSLLALELGAQSQTLDNLSESKALPSITELESLWYELQLQMTKQGETKRFKGQYINASGERIEDTIAHVGPFVAITDTGYLHYDSETRQLLELSKQPSEASLVADFFSSQTDFSPLFIDPTRGVLLSLSSQNPSITDRINQGGLIGYIILTLAFLGLVYAFGLLILMLNTNVKVKAQLKDVDNVRLDNPLGRILSVYENQNKKVDVETLEMKLDEAVLKELPSLEKGLSLIKLLAAVAPLLGLLGTVTGMITTFQSITLFGTGDPKLMAGGISQALITTVLGLVAAIPLLFMHNIVSSRSRELVQILDQQSAGLIAEKAQKGEQ
jgi:biopolymer transport protein ExbB